LKITVIQYLLFLSLLCFTGCQQWRRHWSPLPADPGHGSSDAVAQAVPRGQPPACGFVVPREEGDSVGRSCTPQGRLLQRCPSGHSAGDRYLWRVDLGPSPRRSLAARRSSAARAPLSGPSALARTTAAHRQDFISGYLVFGCRQNETAQAGRLACRAHKSEKQADLSAHVALPGEGSHALLVVALHVRA